MFHADSVGMWKQATMCILLCILYPVYHSWWWSPQASPVPDTYWTCRWQCPPSGRFCKVVQVGEGWAAQRENRNLSQLTIVFPSFSTSWCLVHFLLQADPVRSCRKVGLTLNTDRTDTCHSWRSCSPVSPRPETCYTSCCKLILSGHTGKWGSRWTPTEQKPVTVDDRVPQFLHFLMPGTLPVSGWSCKVMQESGAHVEHRQNRHLSQLTIVFPSFSTSWYLLHFLFQADPVEWCRKWGLQWTLTEHTPVTVEDSVP